MSYYHRLPFEKSQINNATRKVINQHINPLTNTFPYSLTSITNFFIKTQHLISENYPDLSYSQIEKILKNKQLKPAIHQQIQKEIDKNNQAITNTYQRRKTHLEQAYKDQYKTYLKHPIKHQRPDKNQYQISPLSLSDNPYTLDNFYQLSALTFELLEQEKQLENIQNKNYKLEADHQRERQLFDLEEKAHQYQQEQQEIEQQAEIIQLKQTVLKRKMEQLKHLSRISDGYNKRPDQVGITSPETQINVLEQLIAQKRRR